MWIVVVEPRSANSPELATSTNKREQLKSSIVFFVASSAVTGKRDVKLSGYRMPNTLSQVLYSYLTAGGRERGSIKNIVMAKCRAAISDRGAK